MKKLLILSAIIGALASCQSHTPNKCVQPRDYQIDLHMDTVRIYDGDRLVGSYITTWGNQIDTILLKDNL